MRLVYIASERKTTRLWIEPHLRFRPSIDPKLTFLNVFAGEEVETKQLSSEMFCLPASISSLWSRR